MNRWHAICAAVALPGWVALSAIVLAPRGFMGEAQALVAFGMLVIVPLARIVSMPPLGRLNLAVGALHLPAVASLLVEEGALAAALAGPWLVFASLAAAAAGLRLLRRRGIRPFPETAIDAGWLYLPVGAAWFFAHRAGESVMGFHEPIILFTAAHFHFAGLAACVITGAIGRLMPARLRSVYTPAAVLIVSGIALTAAGITAWPLLEVVSAWSLALGVLALAVATLAGVVPRLARTGRRLAAVLLSVGVCSVFLSMAFAAVYSVGEYEQRDLISYETMLDFHAWVNALGFAGLSLLALTLAGRAEAAADRTHATADQAGTHAGA